MMSLKRYILVAILLLAVFMINDYIFTASHEQVHKVIYKSYGIPNATIENSWKHYVPGFPEFLENPATYVSIEDYQAKCNADCISDHNMNEAIGYQMSAVFEGLEVMIILLVLIFMLYKGMDEDDREIAALIREYEEKQMQQEDKK